MMKRRSECEKIKEYMQKAGEELFYPVFYVYGEPVTDLCLHRNDRLMLEDRKHVLHQMWERNQE